MSDIFKTKQNNQWVGIPALKGIDGASAGFDTPTATAYALPSGSNPTVSVTASGPDTEKQFAFTFGIPAGDGGTAQVQSDWNQTNTDAVDYIKNKPDLSLKESTSNKITKGSDSQNEVYENFTNSTDTQYASAKAINAFAQYLIPDYHHFTSATVNFTNDYILNKLHIFDFDTTTNTLTIKYNTSSMAGKYLIWCISPYICEEMDSTHTTVTLKTYTAARKLVLLMRIE